MEGKGQEFSYPKVTKDGFPGLVERQWGWLKNHRGHLTWVLMTGHLLILRIQRPRRPSFFPQLHIWVPAGRDNTGRQITDVNGTDDTARQAQSPQTGACTETVEANAAAP